MELVDGATLRELLASGPLPIKKLLQIAPQIAEGLARAHEAGIVHRDLKPENVMVKKDGLVKILDFGLAKLTSTGSGSDEGSQLPTMTGTQPGVVVGTVSYMSPEQASGQPVDFRSDQFSFGSMLYEMATGKRAFQRKTAIDTLAAILNEEPEPIAIGQPADAGAAALDRRAMPRQGAAAALRLDEDLARDLASCGITFGAISSGSLRQPPSSGPRRRFSFPVLGAIARRGAGRRRRSGDRWLAPRESGLTFRPFARSRFGAGTSFGALRAGRPDRRLRRGLGRSAVEIFTVRTDSTESRPIGLPQADVAAVSSKGELAVLLEEADLVWLAAPWRGFPSAAARRGNFSRMSWDADWAPNGEDLAVLRRLPNGNQRDRVPHRTTLAEGNSITGISRLAGRRARCVRRQRPERGH